MYAEDIRAEARARESELRDALGLADGVPPPRGEWRESPDGRRPRARTANGQVLDDDKDGH
jgi:hypothetical protein